MIACFEGYWACARRFLYEYLEVLRVYMIGVFRSHQFSPLPYVDTL